MKGSLSRVLWVSAVVALVTSGPVTYWFVSVMMDFMAAGEEEMREFPALAVWFRMSLPVVVFAFINAVAACAFVTWLLERGRQTTPRAAAV